MLVTVLYTVVEVVIATATSSSEMLMRQVAVRTAFAV